MIINLIQDDITQNEDLISLKRRLFNTNTNASISSFEQYENILLNSTYVGIGYVAFTNFSSTCELIYNIKQENQQDYVREVNYKKETGTLFPKFPIIILPANITNNEIIRSNLEDALKAETMYHKNNKILFDFRDAGMNSNLYYQVLSEILLHKQNILQNYTISIF